MQVWEMCEIFKILLREFSQSNPKGRDCFGKDIRNNGLEPLQGESFLCSRGIQFRPLVTTGLYKN